MRFKSKKPRKPEYDINGKTIEEAIPYYEKLTFEQRDILIDMVNDFWVGLKEGTHQIYLDMINHNL